MAASLAIMVGSAALPMLVNRDAFGSLGTDVGFLQKLILSWVTQMVTLFVVALLVFLAIVGWVWLRSGTAPRIGHVALLTVVLLAVIGAAMFFAFRGNVDVMK